VVDVFEEVEEQLRSDRYKSLAQRWIPWIVGVLAAVLLAALGVWGYTAYQQQGAAKASLAYAAGLDALTAGSKADAARHFADAANGSSVIYRCLAVMQQAALKVDDKDIPGAVALFDQAAKIAPNDALGDAARLKAAYLLFDTAPLADLQARLQPLADAKRPYRAMAREALAMAELRDGKLAQAKADLKVLNTMLDAPDDLRQRAQATITLIDGGTANAVPAATKAALTLPPLPPMSAAPTGQESAQQSPEAGAAQ
jgi:hypothetical protein